MKKIININLGGYPFTIDVDAYEKMESYFDSLERYFKEYENPHEIIFDIEVRMAELFKENIGSSAIVSIKDIDEVIKILGTPEDISKDNMETDDYSFDNSGEGRQNFRGKNEYKVGKKLYRNPGDKVVAGVCSGLSSYFGILEPIWIRLFFVLLTLSGMSVVLYLVLMVLMPKAKTEADFKAMRGEPIDINTIARSLDEEINNISHQIQDFASTFKNRKKK